MSKKSLLSIFLIFFSTFTLTSSQVFIISPSEVVNKLKFEDIARIRYRIGNFGRVPYGKTILGKIYLIKNTDGTNYWCDENKTLMVPPPEKNTDLEHPDNEYVPIVLVDHNLQCPYSKKALNVQKRGGKVMLLAYDSNSFNDEYNIDDNLSQQIDIPSIIIRKDAADIIKEYLINSLEEKEKGNKDIKQIVMSIKFSGVKENGMVEMELFYRSDNINAINFFNEFFIFKEKLKDKLIFTPRLKYYSFANEKSDNSPTTASNSPCVKEPNKMCTNINYNNELKITNPREILLENIRQGCVNSLFGTDKYWKYMVKLSQTCANLNNPNFNTECSEKIINELDLNNDQIVQCIKDNIEKPGKIEEDYKNFNDKRIYNVPELLINGVKYRGSWFSKHIFYSICNGFIDNEDICREVYLDKDVIQTGGFYYYSLFYLIVVIIIITVISLLCYRRYVNKNLEISLNERIQEQAMKTISNYKQFKDKKTGENVLGITHKLELE